MDEIKTNKPLNEEELTEQPALETQPQPVPATTEEVSQAQEAPVDEAPIEDVPAEEPAATSAMFTPPAEGYVPAGWVKIEDLASAVAQVTGDLEAASTSPDVQPSAIADTEATIPGAAEEPEEEPLVQESAKANKDTLNEVRANAKDHKFAFLICDGNGAASRGGEPDHFYTSECVAKNLKSALLQILPDMLGYDLDEDFDDEELEDMTGDELLSAYSEEVDLGDGSPWIDAVMQDGKVIEDTGIIESMIGDEDYSFDIDPADAGLWGIELPEDDDEDDEGFEESIKRINHKSFKDLRESECGKDFDAMVAEIKGSADLDKDFDNFDDDDDEDFDTMAERINNRSSKRTIREHYDGYLPAGSEHFANDDDLVQSYAEAAASRRKAIRDFRESLKAKRSADLRGRRINDVVEPEVTVDPRFKEALKSSSRIEESANTNSKSWSTNRFQERAEDKLSWKELLAKGFLG